MSREEERRCNRSALPASSPVLGSREGLAADLRAALGRTARGRLAVAHDERAGERSARARSSSGRTRPLGCDMSRSASEGMKSLSGTSARQSELVGDGTEPSAEPFSSAPRSSSSSSLASAPLDRAMPPRRSARRKSTKATPTETPAPSAGLADESEPDETDDASSPSSTGRSKKRRTTKLEGKKKAIDTSDPGASPHSALLCGSLKLTPLCTASLPRAQRARPRSARASRARLVRPRTSSPSASTSSSSSPSTSSPRCAPLLLLPPDSTR